MSNNSSSRVPSSSTTETIATAVFMISVSILATVGNSLVIAAVLWNRRLRTATNFLFLNLAVADFFQGAVAMPLRVAEVLNNTDIQPLIPCLVVIPLTIFFFGASNFNVTLISVDRFVALHWSFLYPVLITPTNLLLIVIGLWCFILVLALLPVFGWGRSSNVDTANICLYSTTLSKEYLFTMFSFVNFGVIIALAVTNLYILRTAQRQIRRIHVIGPNTDANLKSEYSHTRRQMSCISEAEETAVKIRTKGVKGKPAENPETSASSEITVCCGPSCSKRSGRVDDINNGKVNRGNGEDIIINELESNNIGVNNEVKSNKNSINNKHGKQALSFSLVDENQSKSGLSAEPDLTAAGQPIEKKSSRRPTLHRERRATKIVLIIVGIFIVFTTPITVIDIISLSGCASCTPPTVTKIFVCLAYANACVNVFVYAGYKKDMKDTWIAMYKSLRNVLCGRN